jgi:hypothetical protein
VSTFGARRNTQGLMHAASRAAATISQDLADVSIDSISLLAPRENSGRFAVH